jgi:cytidylate kinase
MTKDIHSLIIAIDGHSSCGKSTVAKDLARLLKIAYIDTRRFDEMKAKGQNPSFDEVLKNVKDRDLMDSTRKESPLKQAEDAALLDNSHLSPQEQLDWILDKQTEMGVSF